jgi:His/Glu/Gln/Arg/opine family amino acid ABC transporter permease subunit
MEGGLFMSFNLNVLVGNSSALVTGLLVTCLATLLALMVGIIGAVILQVLRSYPSLISRGLTEAYICFFRTTPEMVLIFWAYFCMPIALGWQVSGLAAGSVTLGLVAAAYLAEILRSGIESVPKGQIEAGQSLGLHKFPLWYRIILPQAVTVMVAPFINYLTELIKNTTLLAAIGVGELAFVAYNMGAQTFRYFEFITAIGIGYFALIFPISMLAHYLEQRKLRVVHA